MDFSPDSSARRKRKRTQLEIEFQEVPVYSDDENSFKNNSVFLKLSQIVVDASRTLSRSASEPVNKSYDVDNSNCYSTFDTSRNVTPGKNSKKKQREFVPINILSNDLISAANGNCGRLKSPVFSKSHKKSLIPIRDQNGNSRQNGRETKTSINKKKTTAKSKNNISFHNEEDRSESTFKDDLENFSLTVSSDHLISKAKEDVETSKAPAEHVEPVFLNRPKENQTNKLKKSSKVSITTKNTNDNMENIASEQNEEKTKVNKNKRKTVAKSKNNISSRNEDQSESTFRDDLENFSLTVSSDHLISKAKEDVETSKAPVEHMKPVFLNRSKKNQTNKLKKSSKVSITTKNTNDNLENIASGQNEEKTKVNKNKRKTVAKSKNNISFHNEEDQSESTFKDDLENVSLTVSSDHLISKAKEDVETSEAPVEHMKPVFLNHSKKNQTNKIKKSVKVLIATKNINTNDNLENIESEQNEEKTKVNRNKRKTVAKSKNKISENISFDNKEEKSESASKHGLQNFSATVSSDYLMPKAKEGCETSKAPVEHVEPVSINRHEENGTTNKSSKVFIAAKNTNDNMQNIDCQQNGEKTKIDKQKKTNLAEFESCNRKWHFESSLKQSLENIFLNKSPIQFPSEKKRREETSNFAQSTKAINTISQKSSSRQNLNFEANKNLSFQPLKKLSKKEKVNISLPCVTHNEELKSDEKEQQTRSLESNSSNLHASKELDTTLHKSFKNAFIRKLARNPKTEYKHLESACFALRKKGKKLYSKDDWLSSDDFNSMNDDEN